VLLTSGVGLVPGPSGMHSSRHGPTGSTVCVEGHLGNLATRPARGAAGPQIHTVLSGVGILPGGSDWSPLPTDGVAYQGATGLDCLMLNGERDGVGLAGRVGVSPLSFGQHNYQTKG
jgi:hypothetical protein